ncbi:MAG: HAD family hydrolase [Alphaproteobacteria bacterium]|nr:HAD family hydrolase [Alphaproteobacteria bacterium]MBU1561699.1 HAD family hydrolase [Alphaproteobacteria bacterium]MBU2301287.1 HAD family hydrolase [Alphaproteobacteria bacterium]MBU2367096.1 HAD family hydrolase [Alphaproteobacteria bacterium]
MWSGPRNLSTAMMRAFSSRPDCAVSDEPFYAAYLAATGIIHPMNEAVLASQPQDPQRVAADMLGPVPGGKPVWYQKHMAHHMIEGFPRDWMDGVTNVFLLRRPERVLASYAQKREDVTLRDIGFAEQADLFDRVADRLGHAPPVIEAEDVRRDPRGALTALCAAIDLNFTDAMLSWPKGQHPDDGVWAPHWYGAIFNTTGFAPPEQTAPALPGHLQAIAEEARPFYERMAAHKG